MWNNKLSRNDFAETYFRRPEYDYYPVVGVSWLQASRYCDWLTDRANEKALMEQGIISKDFYSNDANNQGANAFNLDKFKGNDPEMEAYVNQQRLKQKSQMQQYTVSILTQTEAWVQLSNSIRFSRYSLFQSSPRPKPGCNGMIRIQQPRLLQFQSSPRPKPGCN